MYFQLLCMDLPCSSLPDSLHRFLDHYLAVIVLDKMVSTDTEKVENIVQAILTRIVTVYSDMNVHFMVYT